jgi:PAT family beta-lactamase induction signal transducer AmpG
MLMFPSGLPLGLFVYSLTVWLARQGESELRIGLFYLTQFPWLVKFLWAPLIERFPVPLLGRKRGWVFTCQGVLALLLVLLAALATGPLRLGLVSALALVIAFVAATQDIALDAYAVEVLERHEQGVASGARAGFYRLAMYVSGGVAITAASWSSWPAVFVALGLLFLPAMALTAAAPEPRSLPPPARTFRETVIDPLLGLLRRPRAVEILLFVILFKLPDNLAEALRGVFLVRTGYSDVDVGLAMGTIAVAGTISGAALGGALTTAFGLGRTLWTFGILQILSNFGYLAIALTGPSRPLLYGAMGAETLINGMTTGAFLALLIRLTHRRFSAFQYAVFSSLFAVGRMASGPIAGALADWLGWPVFFALTIPAGLPGLVLLWRFAPPWIRDPALAHGESERERSPGERGSG